MVSECDLTANVLTTVPTAAFRNGDFSTQLPGHPLYDPQTGGAGGVGRTLFPGNVIPANGSIPSCRTCSPSFLCRRQAGTDNNFLATQINPINQNLGTIRADYVINNTSRFFARYTRQQGDSVLNVPAYGSLDYPGSNIAEGNNNSLVANYTRVVTPNLVIEGRFGWTLNDWKQDAIDQASNTSDAVRYARPE